MLGVVARQEEHLGRARDRHQQPHVRDRDRQLLAIDDSRASRSRRTARRRLRTTTRPAAAGRAGPRSTEAAARRPCRGCRPRRPDRRESRGRPRKTRSGPSRRNRTGRHASGTPVISQTLDSLPRLDDSDAVPAAGPRSLGGPAARSSTARAPSDHDRLSRTASRRSGSRVRGDGSQVEQHEPLSGPARPPADRPAAAPAPGPLPTHAAPETAAKSRPPPSGSAGSAHCRRPDTTPTARPPRASPARSQSVSASCAARSDKVLDRRGDHRPERNPLRASLRIERQPQRRLERGQRHLVEPQRRIRGSASIRPIACPVPTMMPHCGPPSSLSPEKSTRSAPAAIAPAAVGSSRGLRKQLRPDRSRADVVDHPEARSWASRTSSPKLRHPR